MRVPKQMTGEQAGGFPVAFRTAYAGLVERAKVAAGQTVLVLGTAGSTGSAAVQLAKALRATISILRVTVTFHLADEDRDPRYTATGGIHVPADGGDTRWFSGDVYSVKLSDHGAGGALGVVEASVPPGGRPVARARRSG